MHILLGNKNTVAIERVFRYGKDELLKLQDSMNEMNDFFGTVGGSFDL